MTGTRIFCTKTGLKQQKQRTVSYARVFTKEAPEQIEFMIGRSIGAKAKNYDIIDKIDGSVYNFIEGTRILNAKVFAGYKGAKPLYQETVDGLVEQYGGKPEKWQHCKGIGTLNVENEEVRAEVHWFQEESVGKVKFKVKRWLDRKRNILGRVLHLN